MYTLRLNDNEFKTVADAIELAKREAFETDDMEACIAAMELAVMLRTIKPDPSLQTTSGTIEVVFDDGRYCRQHGKAPYGRGTWIFELGTGEEVFRFEGILSDAKRLARRHIRETSQPGVHTLHIVP